MGKAPHTKVSFSNVSLVFAMISCFSGDKGSTIGWNKFNLSGTFSAATLFALMTADLNVLFTGRPEVVRGVSVDYTLVDVLEGLLSVVAVWVVVEVEHCLGSSVRGLFAALDRRTTVRPVTDSILLHVKSENMFFKSCPLTKRRHCGTATNTGTMYQHTNHVSHHNGKISSLLNQRLPELLNVEMTLSKLSGKRSWTKQDPLTSKLKMRRTWTCSPIK